MGLLDETNWYAIHTKPHRESVAAFYIERLGLKVFQPRIKQRKVAQEVVKVVTKPLFSNYLFARFCPARYLHLITYARGVRHVVCCAGVPIPVDEAVIQAIESRVNASGYIDIGPREFDPGDRVVIEHGPFRGLVAVLDRDMGDQERVELLIETIEYQSRILIEKRFISPVKNIA